MKIVVNSRNVAHFWANQTQAEARNGKSSMRFSGRTIYSYSTPIGEIVTNARGETAYLVTERSYSQTTSSKHLPAMRSAIPRGALVFRVDNVAAGGQNSAKYCTHEARLIDYRTWITEAENKAKRARTNGDYWRACSVAWMEQANAYCRFFDLSAAFEPDVIDRLIVERKEATERAQAEAARVAAERAERRRKEDAENVVKWLAGGNVMLSYDYPDTLLRAVIVYDEPSVETSKGACVPLEHARRLFDAWTHQTAKAGDKIGVYKVSDVRNCTEIIIGCHRITRAEAERFASSQGWM